MNNSNREWMYDRILEDGFINPRFIDGVEDFVAFSKRHPQCMDGGKLRCPCNHRKCRNKNILDEFTVMSHLGTFGFVPGYYCWYHHGESYPYPSVLNGHLGETLGETMNSQFVPNGRSISKSITETFKERQDATGYSWKDVSESIRKFYWHEFVKLYQWNPSNTTVIEHTWGKVASTLYSKKLHRWRKRPRPTFVPEDVWESWKTYWASDKWLEKSRIATQNRHSETGGPGTGPSKHTGGSKSTVEHTIKLAIDLRRPANLWDVFKKLHKRKDGSFVDPKSKSINDEMEARVAAAISSSDDSQEVQELDVNSIYLDVVGGEKKRRVYGLGSQALTMYKDYNSATSCNIVTDRAADQERIKLLEEEMLRMKENQERILQERVEAEVQQRVEKEVSDRFKSMEDRWSHMMSVMGLSSRSSGSPTLPNRDSPNA
ncbi:uncharacterized protein LOC132631039 [Lycium barbarum]|uniref:uncharacterized protein LOC132631039 n=1 Tax=Lycium barbarum TaxID=112863 RepID=UPI00293EEDD4|nr:uncharacterized protein LOC132631039 [Lycium barbarum]